jgi:DNA-binding transcriptional LysR family regulator
MAELDDLALFAAVVEHGGYAAAERALGTPKSRLSRRVAALEADLGVRLLQRSTRRFSVTDVGQDVYRHARAMLEEARAAREAVARLSAEPRGLVRLSCPVAFAQSQLSQLLPEFLDAHPQVQLQVHVSNRRVDLIEEGFDLALRVRSRIDDDSSLVIRHLGEVRELLVASPAYLERAGRPTQPEELAAHATLNMVEDPNRQQWELHGPAGELRRVQQAEVETHQARPRSRGRASRCCRSWSAPTACMPACWSRCCRTGACRSASATWSIRRVAACCRRSAR